MKALLLLALLSVQEPALVPWRAWLDSPGGPLPFELELELGKQEGTLRAAITNGAEKIEVEAALKDGALRLEFPHYDARIVAKFAPDGRTLAGEWTRARAHGAVAKLPFLAEAGAGPRFDPIGAGADDPARIVGRWSVRFEGDERAAVGLIEARGRAVGATILTATGDHRYLAGTLEGGRLRLSTFDGAHAFLYDARLVEAGVLRGTFWSGDAHHETFEAKRDDEARLADEFALASWSANPGLAWIGGLGADGKWRSLADEFFDSRALLVQIAGSWCPNCHDELAWLAPLAKELAPAGLATVTLGFELGGDPTRDLEQLARMRKRHRAAHEFWLVGEAHKDRAAQALGALDHVVAFPTLALFDGAGRATFVHTGFRGPAAGAEHEELTADLGKRIRAAVAADPPPSNTLDVLVAEILWRDERDRLMIEIRRGEEGVVRYVTHEMLRFDGPTNPDPIAQGEVEVRGSSVRFLGATFQVDAATKCALDPRDLSHRLTPAARGPFPYYDGFAHDAPEKILAGLTSPRAEVRRESAWFLAQQIVLKQSLPPDYAPNVDPASAVNLIPLCADPDPLVRATACWAAGLLQLEGAKAKLEESADHPFEAVRREARRALELLSPAPRER